MDNGLLSILCLVVENPYALVKNLGMCLLSAVNFKNNFIYCYI